MYLGSLIGARSASGVMRDAVSRAIRSLKREEQLSGNMDEFRLGMRNLEKKIEEIEAQLIGRNLEGPDNQLGKVV